MLNRMLGIAGAILVFGGLGFAITQKETILRHGQTAYLDLAPRDPRSLMQGDYMALRYRIASWVSSTASPDGCVVLVNDARGVSQYLRIQDAEPLAPGEFLLRYRRRHGNVRLGSDAFFFQEGTGPLYTQARFGEFRISPKGEALLVGLRDAELKPLGAPVR